MFSDTVGNGLRIWCKYPLNFIHGAKLAILNKQKWWMAQNFNNFVENQITVVYI